MFGLKKTDPFERQLSEEFMAWPNADGRPEPVTVDEATRGFQLFGATGSGKTSGSAKVIREGLLSKGYGGIIFCVKADEGDAWRKIIADAGRTSDLVDFSKSSGLEFNPLVYEMERSGDGAGETLNIVDMVMSVYQLGRNFMAGNASGGELFWENAMRRLLSRSIDLLRFADEPVTFSNIRRIVLDAPKPETIKELRELEAQLNEAQGSTEAAEAIDSFLEDSFCLSCLTKADEWDMDKDETETFELVQMYFMREYAYLSDRTRSSVEEHLYGLIEPFLTGILRNHFARGLSPELNPERIYKENKLFLIDFSVKEYGVAGVYGMGIAKYITQQVLERRRPKEDGFMLPAFIWIDEAQNLINPAYDSLFQTTARSSLVITVYITQSLPNYTVAMGGSNAEVKAKSLLANLGTKVFHANTDFNTNQYASNMIGYHVATMGSRSMQIGDRGSASLSEQLMLQVQPNAFITLRNGRKENSFEVDGYIVKAGPWRHTDANFIKGVFHQKK